MLFCGPRSASELDFDPHHELCVLHPPSNPLLARHPGAPPTHFPGELGGK